MMKNFPIRWVFFSNDSNEIFLSITNEKQAQFFLLSLSLPWMQFFTVDETNNSKKYFSTIHFYYYLVEKKGWECWCICARYIHFSAIHIHNVEWQWEANAFGKMRRKFILLFFIALHFIAMIVERLNGGSWG